VLQGVVAVLQGVVAVLQGVVAVLQKSVRQHPHGTGVPRAAFITLCNMERDNPAVATTNIDDPGCQM